MRASLQYSLARILLFLVCLFVLWLCGLKEPLLLLLASATLSLGLSLWLLSGLRERMSAEVAERVEGRAARRRDDGVLTDDEAEDVEIADRDRP